jgi:hypothetical protein
MFGRIVVAAGVAFALTAPASALTQITSPVPAYRTATFLLGVPGNGTPRTGWGDAFLNVGFSIALEPRTVGVNWATWGSPPDTEQDNPRIWFTQGGTSLTFTFDSPVAVWGFEAEPNPFADIEFTVEYFSGATSLGTITRTINGNAGARLLAAAADVGDSFTSVTVSADSDFAIAQLRYAFGRTPFNLVPEPATWAMMMAGFGLVGFAMRRRRATAVTA